MCISFVLDFRRMLVDMGAWLRAAEARLPGQAWQPHERSGLEIRYGESPFQRKALP